MLRACLLRSAKCTADPLHERCSCNTEQSLSHVDTSEHFVVQHAAILYFNHVWQLSLLQRDEKIDYTLMFVRYGITLGSFTCETLGKGVQPVVLCQTTGHALRQIALKCLYGLTNKVQCFTKM